MKLYEGNWRDNSLNHDIKELNELASVGINKFFREFIYKKYPKITHNLVLAIGRAMSKTNVESRFDMLLKELPSPENFNNDRIMLFTINGIPNNYIAIQNKLYSQKSSVFEIVFKKYSNNWELYSIYER